MFQRTLRGMISSNHMKKIALFVGLFACIFIAGCSRAPTPQVFDGVDAVEPYGVNSEQPKPDFENVSSWPNFYIKELGFSIKFPFMPGQVHRFDDFFYSFVKCDKLSCGDKQYAEFGDFKEQYKAMGSVSKDYKIGTSWQIHEVYDVNIKADKLVILGSQGKTKEVTFLKKFKNDAGTLEGVLVPVKNSQDITQKDAFSGEDGYAAFFKLPQNKNFKAVVFYFKTTDLPLAAFEKALRTITFDAVKK